MQISVTARHSELSERTKRYAEEKASRLSRYHDRLQTVDIVFDKEADLSSVEMIVKASGTPEFVAKEVGPSPKACVDLLLDKMERQLIKHKERNHSHKHLAPKTALPETHEPEIPGEEEA